VPTPSTSARLALLLTTASDPLRIDDGYCNPLKAFPKNLIRT
jgi:hypothetical protein